MSGRASPCILNVLDGDWPQPDEMLGTALGVPGGYDIRLHVRVELAVAGGTAFRPRGAL